MSLDVWLLAGLRAVVKTPLEARRTAKTPFRHLAFMLIQQYYMQNLFSQ